MNTETEKDQSAASEESLANAAEVKRLKRRIGLKHGLFEAGDFTLLVLQSATVLLAVFAAIPFILQLFMGVQLNTVLSGSMSGTAEVGELIQTQPYLGQELTVGTIVGIEQGNTRYTHRIVEVLTDDKTGEVSYVTKGDANNTKDLFHPTSKNIWGVVTNIVHQPLAFSLTMFSWNTQWMDAFVGAVTAMDFDAIGGLLPNAPWGLLILIAAVALFWWVVPDILAAVRSKQAKRDELAMTLLKRQVNQHEEDIETELKPTITELKPVVEEYQAEKAEKAEAHARALEAEETLWGQFGNLDAESVLFEEDSTPFVEPLPTPANPFEALKARKDAEVSGLPFPTISARTDDGLNEFLPRAAQTFTLPDLEPRPSLRTPSERVDELAQKFLAMPPTPSNGAAV